MSVNPGFGGQSFIPQSEKKIAAARALLDRAGNSAPVEVDGGIDQRAVRGDPDDRVQLVFAGRAGEARQHVQLTAAEDRDSRLAGQRQNPRELDAHAMANETVL